MRPIHSIGGLDVKHFSQGTQRHLSDSDAILHQDALREIEMQCVDGALWARVSGIEEDAYGAEFMLPSFFSSDHIAAVTEVLGRLLSRFPCEPKETDYTARDVVLLIACSLTEIDRIEMPLFYWTSPNRRDQLFISGEAFDPSTKGSYTWSLRIDVIAIDKNSALPEVPAKYHWTVDANDHQSFIHSDDWPSDQNRYGRCDREQLQKAVILARHLQVALHGVIVYKLDFAEYFWNVVSPGISLVSQYGTQIPVLGLLPLPAGPVSLCDLDDIIIETSIGPVNGTSITLCPELASSVSFVDTADTQSLQVIVPSRHPARLVPCLKAFHNAFTRGRNTWQAFLECARVADIQARLIEEGEPVTIPPASMTMAIFVLTHIRLVLDV